MIDGARKTAGGRVVFGISVISDGRVIDQVNASGAANGRRQAADPIRQHQGDVTDQDRAKLDLLIAQMVADAAVLARSATVIGGATIRDKIKARVLGDLGCTHRTDGGPIWSEARGAEMGRQDFICNFTSDLVDDAATGTDAPKNDQGQVNRPALIKAVKAELEVMWGDLMRLLPLASGAELTDQTAAAKKFRQAMILLWTYPSTWEKDGEHVKRASLVSRASERARQRLEGFRVGQRQVEGTKGWRRIIDSGDAFWRTDVVDRQIVTRLAMRWHVAGQMRLELPGVTDQNALSVVGRQFGLIESWRSHRRVTDEGRSTTEGVAVLARKFSDELLYRIEDEVEQDEPGDSG
jgi:hypothetical protein